MATAGSFYTDNYPYMARLDLKTDSYYREALSLVSKYVPAGGAVLEVGCGTGRLSSLLAATGFAVTATDISALFVRTAAERYRRQGLAFVVADARVLPLPAALLTWSSPTSLWSMSPVWSTPYWGCCGWRSRQVSLSSSPPTC